MNQLKSVYNIPFLDSYSHPIHTYLSIASNVEAIYLVSTITSNDR